MIQCFSSLTTLKVKDTKLQLDSLFHYIMKTQEISKWFTQLNKQKPMIPQNILNQNCFELQYNKSIWKNEYTIKTVDNVPIKILDDIGLYLGSIKAAKNIKKLKEFNITYILDCSNYIIHEQKQEITNNIHKLYIPINDTLSENLSPIMDISLEFINNAITSNNNILVHCYMGVSRSVSLIIGYLMKYHKYNLKESLHLIECKREFVRPNTNFLIQLQNMEKELFNTKSYIIERKQINRYNERKKNIK